MTINKTILSKSQADALFQREAVLIGNRDVVPEGRLVDMLGESAAKHAKGMPGAGGALWNAYGMGDGRSLPYFTYKGFLEAVAYNNLQLLADGGSNDA